MIVIKILQKFLTKPFNLIKFLKQIQDNNNIFVVKIVKPFQIKNILIIKITCTNEQFDFWKLKNEN